AGPLVRRRGLPGGHLDAAQRRRAGPRRPQALRAPARLPRPRDPARNRGRLVRLQMSGAGGGAGAGGGGVGGGARPPHVFRVGAGAFSQAGLDRWLQEGAEVLRAERTQLPATPTAFLLAPGAAAGATAFVGVLAPSADAAGRSFPLALFNEVPTAAARD